MNPYKKLSPFKWFVIQNFPFIEEDFDAITEYQLLCKVVEYLNKTIDKTNELGVKVEELNNWFINLDVQDEIDNKLNEMAEDGTLAEIINEQIFNELNSAIQENTNAIEELQRRKFLIVGDSYLEGWTPDGTYTNWGQFFENITGFECDITAQGGAGFANGNLSYYNLINNVSTVDYTDVIIMGGYNDRNSSFSDIVVGVTNTVALIKTKFEDLKNIYIGMCGNSLDDTNVNKFVSTLYSYIHGAKINNCKYLNGIEYSLNNSSYFSSDGIHPNQNGLYSIAINLVNAVKTGSANFVVSFSGINVTLTEDFTSGSFTNFGGYTNNNITQISKQGFTSLICNNLELKANLRDTLKIGDLSSSLLLRGNYSNCIIQGVSCIVENGTNNFYECQAQLLIYQNALYLKLLKINDDNSDYVTFDEIKQIQISPFNATFISNTI